MQQAITLPGVALVALARREVPLPSGAHIESVVADPAGWHEAVGRTAPEAVICALGTTWRKAERSEAAFRAVDNDLVLALARAAKEAGARQFVLVSSVGADAGARSFYLRVKGEVEAALAGLGFSRLDILRPGLLRGHRSGDRRLLERLGILLSPLANLLLRGPLRRYRSVAVGTVAAAALQALREEEPGHFVHENEGIERLADRLECRT